MQRKRKRGKPCLGSRGGFVCCREPIECEAFVNKAINMSENDVKGYLDYSFIFLILRKEPSFLSKNNQMQTTTA